MSPIEATQRWVERIVIGLGLCPFAKSVFDAKKIRYQVCEPTSVAALLDELTEEYEFLDAHPETSTTLLIYPEGLEDYRDYLDVLAAAADRLVQDGYAGTYQLATFHPDYVFDECADDDPANETNCSPFPTIHIIREEELSLALDGYPSPERIPERNMRICRELGQDGLKALLTKE